MGKWQESGAAKGLGVGVGQCIKISRERGASPLYAIRMDGSRLGALVFISRQDILTVLSHRGRY